METVKVKWLRPGWQTVTVDGVARSVGDVGEVDATRLERFAEGADYTVETAKPKPKPKPKPKKATKDPDTGGEI